MVGPPGFSAIIGLLASVLIARVFGAEGRGIYAINITWMMTIGQIVSMGLGDALAVTLRRYGGPSHPRLFIIAYWLAFATLAVMVGLAGLAPLLATIGALSAGALLQSLSFMLAAGSRRKWAVALLVQPISVLSVSIFAATRDLDVSAVLIAYVAAPIVSAGLFLSDLRPPADQSVAGGGPQYGRVLRIGGQRQLTVTLSSLVRSVDILALGFFFSPQVAGVYAVSRSLLNLCLLAPQAMSGLVLRSELSGKPQSKSRVLLTLGGWTLLGLVPVLALGWFVVPIVWGEEFRQAYVVFLVLSLGCLASGASRGVLAWRSARDIQGRVPVRFAALSLPLAALIVGCAAVGGMYGAAAGSTISSLVLLAAAWRPVRAEK